MRVKTSVTLPRSLLVAIDRADHNRSAFLERAAREHLARIEKQRRNARDAEILSTHATRLNQEALDVLEYQDLG